MPARKADRPRNTGSPAKTASPPSAAVPQAIAAHSAAPHPARPNLQSASNLKDEPFPPEPKTGCTDSQTNPNIHAWSPRAKSAPHRAPSDPAPARDEHSEHPPQL